MVLVVSVPIKVLSNNTLNGMQNGWVSILHVSVHSYTFIVLVWWL